jgi:hypothetical protein
MKGQNGLRKEIMVLAMLAIISFVLLSGCTGLTGSNTQPTYEGGGVAPPQPYDNSKSSFTTPESTSQTTNVYTNLSDRKVIMAASVQLETSEHDKVVNAIRGIAAGAGGYVESSSTWLTAQDRKQTTITIKVPSAQYEQCLSQIKALGKVKSESSSGQDVTRQYVDLSARLKNLQAEEKQLSELMGMSKNVTEVLMVEKELYRVRGEIESTQAQLNYLGSQVDFSTITVTVMEPQPVVEYDWGLDTAFKEGVRAFIGMIGALIVLTGYIIPLLLYLAIAATILYLIARAAWGFYRKKKQAK